MPEWTFSHLSAELLDILRERYPDGLTTSRPPNPEKTTPIPADDSEVTIVYGVPKSMDDLSMGWKDLKAKGGDTLADKKLGEQSVVAFALVDADDEDGGRVEFEVELPTFEDDQGEEEL
ncbi:hypothetical protein B0T16DRAFT_70849 [Cercophora newfieldiana]|uniref:Uncharacterized protein n=1 Tax=Cercophora newfieldiana TaxID=92897 RepID=A0AA40D2B6_9PEZI|nr:hypothetical protein B0T16DRAFT_70849 [Cercophora newfieldiana]